MSESIFHVLPFLGLGLLGIAVIVVHSRFKNRRQELSMLSVLFALVGVTGFGALIAYVALCDRL